MLKTAVIGGTGLASMEGLAVVRREMVKTPFGAPSGPLLYGNLNGAEIVFLARHGHLHSIPPHRINYCANLWALHSVGVEQVISVGVVEGIEDACQPGCLVVPDQLIDYTVDRDNTFHDGGPETQVVHADFVEPYSAALRSSLLDGAAAAGQTVIDGGTYGVVQGPRRSTRAEIRRMAADGCTLSGMTAMPEAVLARELELAYANLAVVIKRADENTSADETTAVISQGMDNARAIIAAALGS